MEAKEAATQPPQDSLTTPQSPKEVNSEANMEPSKTLKTYADPSGFSFSYPDNLSLYNNELKDDNTYAELQLTAKGVEGRIILKIADSKLKSLDEGKEVKLGGLKAKELETEDKVVLKALDSGVLFNIEADKKDPSTGLRTSFWLSVYKTLVADFTFTQPQQESTISPGVDDSISFEGEEVVE